MSERDARPGERDARPGPSGAGDATDSLFEDLVRMLGRDAPASHGKGNGRPGVASEDRQDGEGANGPFGHVPVGAFEATVQGGISDANGALARLLDYRSEQDLVGRSLAELIVDPATLDRVLGHARNEQELVGEEVPLRTRQGEKVVGLLSTRLVGSDVDGGRRVVGALMDITERKNRQSHLERLAFQDPLTGVANRRALADHAKKYLALAERRGTLVGLVYLDLTGFKAINDRYGHAAGDAVLVESARRLEAGAREGDVVSRVGGDEFVVLLPDVDDRDAVVTATRRLEGALEEAPIEIEDGQAAVAVRAEAGTAVYPDHGSRLEDLVRAADQAMYRAKERPGRARPRQEGGGLARRWVAGADRPSSRRAQL